MTELKRDILDNHTRYSARKALYRKHGYDMDREHAFILEKAVPISGNILEAGTGKGYFALTLARQGYCFTSFDISEEEQNYAKLNLRYYGLEPQVCCHIANAESLHYEDGYYDVIFSVNMIHHLATAEKVIEEMIRVLAPAGKMVWSDFNPHGLSIIDRIHSLENRRHEVGETTLRDVEQLLRERGFTTQWHPSDCQDTIIACRNNSNQYWK